MDDLYGNIDEDLRKWFGRKGAPGKKKGWVDCNTCRKDKKTGRKKCSACGRSKGEKRKYPACRPTPSACGKKGKWGKKSKKKNEDLKMDLQQIVIEELEAYLNENHTKQHEEELKTIVKELEGASKMHASQAERIQQILDETDDEELKENKKNCGCGQDPCKTYGIQENVNEETLDEKRKKKKKKKSGKKDACYHKVKSRYKVWPSAYASGALVKCRKVGAKNWGNSKKESLQIVIEDELTQYINELRCWDGHRRVKGKTPGEPGSCEKIKEVEADLEEKKKKKACKPSKGKRFAKRVNGKCRSFGQKGQAKGGGDRIRPGTKKGDAYCARSAKIKKCKNPPCANALSRKKWKCRGSKSMKE